MTAFEDSIKEIERLANEASTLGPLVACVVTHPTDGAILLYEMRERRMFVRADALFIPDEAGFSFYAGGVELRRSPWIPLGHAALLDGKGNLIRIVKLNDHTP